MLKTMRSRIFTNEECKLGDAWSNNNKLWINNTFHSHKHKLLENSGKILLARSSIFPQFAIRAALSCHSSWQTCLPRDRSWQILENPKTFRRMAIPWHAPWNRRFPSRHSSTFSSSQVHLSLITLHSSRAICMWILSNTPHQNSWRVRRLKVNPDLMDAKGFQVFCLTPSARGWNTKIRFVLGKHDLFDDITTFYR